VSAGRPGDGPGLGPELPGDLFEDIVSGEPGLGQLFGRLTSAPTPDELSGANAALAMFRAHAPTPTSAGPGPLAPQPRGPGSRAPGSRAPGAHASSPHAPGSRALRTSQPHSVFNARAPRRLAAVTVTLAAAAGFAVAAYTSTLPPPIQHAASRMLGFAGVPDTRPGAAGTAGALHPAGTGPAAGRPGARGESGPPPASGSPGASAPAPGAPGAGQAGLSVAASSGRITSGDRDTFTGRLSDRGRAVAGVRLSLEERAAGQAAWRVVGSGVTDATGGATVAVSGLTRNGWFRFAGQGSELSQPLLVVVVPPLSVSVAAGTGGRADALTVRSRFASPGDRVVLQVWSGTRWRDALARDLDVSGQVTFMVRAPDKQQRYRAVLLGTMDHGMSVSATVTLPPRFS
jgi:hypothetical protein